MRDHERHWKPGTRVVNGSHLKNQILPTFGSRDIAQISHQDVTHWFAELREKPAAANRSLSILSLIMRQAEFFGYRNSDSNPCIGVRRYRCPGRERFLTADEFGRLGAALRRFQGSAPTQSNLIRLLVLTGCRQSELRTLAWTAYRARNLYLHDSKTGPRTIWLSSAARAILDALPRTSKWVFPAACGTAFLSNGALYRSWKSICAEAALPALRLHDLRHSYASFALRDGESLLTTGRLLGHRDPSTTLKYAHFADDMARAAVERIGDILGE